MAKTINPHRRSSADRIAWRLATLKLGVFIAMAAIIFRLLQLQVLGHDTYTSMASEQQVRQSTILAKRGIIYATERDVRGQEKKIPLALNRDTWTVFADTRKIQNINQSATVLSELLKMPAEEILNHLKKENDPYEPIKQRVAEEVAVLF